jgi:DNA sulfur modification protein DndB
MTVRFQNVNVRLLLDVQEGSGKIRRADCLHSPAHGVPLAEASFEYVFPAIRGIQARREFYVSMCPLRLLSKVFLFDEDELVPEIRAQRTLNKARLPEIARYIVENPKDYVFSAITASVDGDVRFESIAQGPEGKRVGQLHIPMSARFIINDGQHRRAAIELALREKPELGDESIAVVFFVDQGLERCQQMFADLNRYGIRPSKSIGVLYDHRDPLSQITRKLVKRSDVFGTFVEMEKTTLAARSRKLFTLSAVYSATAALIAGLNDLSEDELVLLAGQFWESVAEQFPEWMNVRDGRISAGEVRREYIHTHGVVLQAIGRAGNALLRRTRSEAGWKKRLKKLSALDWSRNNAELWEGRALVGGRVSKSGQNVTLTTNVVKQVLELPLTPEEDELEQSYIRGNRG